MKRWVKWASWAVCAVVGISAVFFVGSYVAFAGQFAVPATTVDDPALPSRSVDGYRFHFEAHGLPTEPAVIVLHGGPGGDYRYLLPLKRLSDDFQVVFYDQRGTGLSPRGPEEQIGMSRYLEDLHQLGLAVSPHAPLRLVGHGWGGVLAAAYLGKHPERVSHAVLAEPAFLTTEQRTRWQAIAEGRDRFEPAALFSAWRAFIESLYVYGPDAAARSDYLDQASASRERPEHSLAGLYCHRDPRGAYLPVWRAGRGAAAAFAAHGLGGRVDDVVTAGLARFPHEVLLLAGSCNTLTGPELQRQNLSLFAQAELAIVDDAGHTMIGEKPEATLELLRSYLLEDHSAIVASD